MKIDKHYNQAVREIHTPCQLDLAKPFRPQVDAIIAQAWAALGDEDEIRLAINFPALSAAAVLVEKYMADSCSEYDLIRIAPVKGAMPPQFEIAEIFERSGLYAYLWRKNFVSYRQRKGGAVVCECAG